MGNNWRFNSLMGSLSQASILRSTIQGQTNAIPRGTDLAGVTLNITSASVSSDGILTFSWTPLSANYGSYFSLDFAITSNLVNGTGFSSTFPGANAYNDELFEVFDEPRKNIQNIYNTTTYKWKSSAAIGNPYDSRTPQNIVLGQGSEGCSGFNTTYSNLRSYYGMAQHYPIVNRSSSSATIDLKLIQNDSFRSAQPSWIYESKLTSGSARILIRPFFGGGSRGAWGSSYYAYGNWSFYDVTIPTNNIFSALKAGGQNTNYRLEGRTVKWDLDSCTTNFYMYLYKNGSVLRNGYIGNDNNPNAYNGRGDLAYTVPSGDGAGSYQLYISNYYTPTNSFGDYTNFSFSL